ncbi:MAG: orotate phosphoribosyltransferase [Candidatus Altiarchaeales archaeon IMC4]|nr:MAG: orotate phosphoribosyltransferase [Candidatus Altiarchaeales archaeon IMC4]
MKDTVARALVEAGVVRFGDFTLTSGKKSPIYVDLRVLPSHPVCFDEITGQMADAVRSICPKRLAGAETAGIPIAAVLSIKCALPMVYVRKKPKSHGTKSQIEGIIEKDDSVLLVDDMVTDGGSKVAFIEAIRKEGGVVTDAIVILDRGQGGAENLTEHNVKLHCLITLDELLDYMESEDLIEADMFDLVKRYLSEKDAK